MFYKCAMCGDMFSSGNPQIMTCSPQCDDSMTRGETVKYPRTVEETKQPERLQNKYLSLVFDGNDITGRDFEDRHNEPVFFTKSKRGLLKTWVSLKKEFNDETKFWDTIYFVRGCGLKVHTYYAMD